MPTVRGGRQGLSRGTAKSRIQRLGSAAAEGAPRDREVIALVGLAHGTSHFFHLMLPPLFSWLMRDFSLSYTDARVSRLRT
jgi:hypothetical protein